MTRHTAVPTDGGGLSVTAGGTTTSYALDGAGNRWSQTTGAATTAFDLDLAAAQPTVLYDGQNKYLPGAPGAGYDQGAVWWNALPDQLGSPIEYVSQTGTTSTPIHYDPFGAPRPGNTAAIGIGYGAEYRDATGLINLRARSYDPVLARFIGRDTFGGVASAPQTANRYAYALANPLRYTDPSGHLVQAVIHNPGLVIEVMAMVGAPEVAIPYLFLCGAVGYDPLTGHSLSPLESGLYMLPGLGKIGAAFMDAWRATEGAEALGALGREVGAAARLESKAGSVFGRIKADVGELSTQLRNQVRTFSRSIANDGGYIRWSRAAEEGVVSAAGTGGRAIPHGFANSAEFEEFSSRLNAGLDAAGYSETRAAFQGSSVTGRSFDTGVAFDVGRTSDYDIALSGGDVFGAARGAGIGLRSGGIRTGPLSDLELERMGLTNLRADLSDLAGRDVNFMIYRSIDDALSRSLSILVPRR